MLHEKLEIGITSVTVATDVTRSDRAIVACDQVLYALEYLGRRGSSGKSVMLNKIWLTDPGNTAFMQQPLSCFTQASSRIPTGYSTFGAGSLFYLAESILLLADLSSATEPEMVPRRLPLNGTPATVFYSSSLNKLVVLYTTTSARQGSADAQRDRVSGGKRQPAIAFIDPDTETLRSRLGDEDGDDVLQQSHVEPEERYLGIMQWYPRNQNHSYHVLVVNTVIGQPTSEEATGRLLLFHPSVSDDGKIALSLKHERKFHAPVWCVEAYGDSSLIHACGDDIVLRKLDVSTKKFITKIKMTLRSRATHISVEGNVIHVSTKGSGHHMFQVKDDSRLVPLCADASSRSDVHHLSFPEASMVITTDSECRVTGLWKPPQSQLGKTAPLLFEANLPSSITRLCLNSRPLWQQKLYPSLQRASLLGSSEDGALYHLVILREPLWRLLAFIQNMALRDPRICPYALPLVHERHIEPRSVKKQDMHINGDVLCRLLEQGGDSLLEAMLDKEPDPDPYNRSADYTTADDRRKRFVELVSAACGTDSSLAVRDAVLCVEQVLVSAI